MKISRYLNYLIICEKLYLGVYRKVCVNFRLLMIKILKLH